KEYIDLMIDHTEHMLDRWQDGEVYNMNEEMTTVTMGVIGEVLFGIKDIEKDASELAEALDVILDNFMAEVIAIMPVPEWVPTPRNLKQHQAIAYAHEYVDEIIKQRRERDIDTGDVLSGLMFAEDEETGDTLTNEQIRDMLLSLFIAGHDSTARLMTWALYNLARHPDNQGKLYDDVAAVMTKNDPSLEDLAKMTYTDQVLQETMRLHPPFWSLFTRRVLEPITLGEVTIPKGALIYISPYAVHRDERWWPDPQTFDPERFAPGWKDRVPSYAFMPFGGGPRVCVASHMAEMEAEVILATIVKRFKIELPTPDTVVEPMALFSLHPEGGQMPLRIVARE
ncbi:MAG: cytochrome P450, partial [Chloroflexota bacterium]